MELVHQVQHTLAQTTSRMPTSHTKSSKSSRLLTYTQTALKKAIKMPDQQHQKLTLKDITMAGKQVVADLSKLQKEGNTLPDILYNYHLQDGHLVRKRKRAGSTAGDVEEEADKGVNGGKMDDKK